MPPKDKAAEKARAAAKAKALTEATFGLKNKNKSAKVQQYVQSLEKQAANRAAQANKPAEDAKKKKKTQEEQERELAALFAVAIKQPKVPPGVDPKSIVCEFFRHGQCTKGFKCKFSHDLGVERKGPKIDLFTDQRDLKKEGGEGAEGEGGMEEWDQATLEKAIAEKHASDNRNKPTEIICKFFLDAVERKSYGWFWKCPNGTDCKYRHGLPPGYVLKSQMKELLEEEARNKKDVTEAIEEERQKVEARTPITEQVFKEWRRKRQEAKQRQRDEEEAERRKKGVLNGREIFMQEGFEALDDASAAVGDEYAREDDEEATINDMFDKARKAEEAARKAATAEAALEQAEAVAAAGGSGAAAVGAGLPGSSAATAAAAGSSSSSAGAAAGPSTSSSAAGPSQATLRAVEEAGAEVFDDDDDDEEDIGDDDDDEDDDLGDDDLEALEQHIKTAANVAAT